MLKFTNRGPFKDAIGLLKEQTWEVSASKVRDLLLQATKLCQP
jgi:hypothetical protein